MKIFKIIVVIITVKTTTNAKQSRNTAKQLKERHVYSLLFLEEKRYLTVYLDQKELSHGVQQK